MSLCDPLYAIALPLRSVAVKSMDSPKIVHRANDCFLKYSSSANLGTFLGYTL